MSWVCCFALACSTSSSDEPIGIREAFPTAISNRPADGEDCENTFPVDTLPPNDDIHMGVRIPNEAALPEELSETGLYADIASKTVHSAMRSFTPRFQLWSDEAHKQRWIYIPECDTVDTSDMNNWVFPVGTRMFKEFAIDGRRIETRIIERIGSGPRDYAFASYQWNADETEATKVSSDGIPNASSTTHDIPSKAMCLQCHGSHSVGGGRPSRGLGFSAIQLAHDDSGVSLDTLASEGAISTAPDTMPSIPGTAEDQAALGYLHANCGNCHNSTNDRVPQITLDLWLDVGLTNVEDTAAWKTAVDQPTELFKDQHIAGRIVPGSPSASALLYRMGIRGNNGQMPPIASKQVDTAAMEDVAAWIEGLE